MTILAGVLAILAFSAAFMASRLLPLAAQAAAVARGAVAVLNDRALDDDAKEHAAQTASAKLMVAFLNITLRSAAVLAAPLLTIWLLDRAGLVRMSEVFGFLVSPLVLVATVVAAALVYLVRR